MFQRLSPLSIVMVSDQANFLKEGQRGTQPQKKKEPGKQERGAARHDWRGALKVLDDDKEDCKPWDLLLIDTVTRPDLIPSLSKVGSASETWRASHRHDGGHIAGLNKLTHTRTLWDIV
jgi:hypothetical protein